MSKQQTFLCSALLLLPLLNLVICRHPFDFFDESYDEFVDCLNANNLTHEEYEKFESFENKANLLNDKVELKYKCSIDCQLQRQPQKWLNQEGRLDLQLINATQEAAQAIIKCMAGAPNEQCAYSFKLVMCAYLANHPVIDYDEDEDIDELPDDYDYTATTLGSD
ncbi:general odorant-binding protein 57b-like isoform X2 [Drosophila innubila]|uniref:general odorant-binding protein 57b-like isoform X2 n=1 Tax=Drosophila innubila TaxID=198719 RepID=UPI00148C1108|nr:general odorant-binding protein 57b-like isoform X2 [Drosophila innubila]